MTRSLSGIFLLLLLTACGRNETDPAVNDASVESINYAFQIRNTSRRPAESAAIQIYLPVEKTDFHEFVDYKIRGKNPAKAKLHGDELGNQYLEMRIANVASDFRAGVSIDVRVRLAASQAEAEAPAQNSTSENSDTSRDLPSVIAEIVAGLTASQDPASFKPDSCVHRAQAFVAAAAARDLSVRTVIGLNVYKETPDPICWVDIHSEKGWQSYEPGAEEWKRAEGKLVALRILAAQDEVGTKTARELLSSTYGLDISPIAYDVKGRQEVVEP
jgi:hypothetical protein